MNFQAESKKTGDIFEDIVMEDLVRSKRENIQKHLIIDAVGVEADFAYTEGDIQVYVEAKGGSSGNGKRPGAKRTDNVKKAIANAALVKAVYPDSKYVLYFSDLPNHGKSAHKMLKTAVKAGYVDKIVYLVAMDQ